MYWDDFIIKLSCQKCFDWMIFRKWKVHIFLLTSGRHNPRSPS
jgi:hypothetical protein